MSFQLKRGDEVIDGFRVLEPICEKQEYAIYRVADGRYAICITADLKEVWENGNWIPDAFVSGQLHPLSCGFCYLTESGYKLYTPQHGPYPDDWESAEGFCSAFARFQKKYKEGQCPNVLYIEKYDWMLPLKSEDDEKESPELLLGRWLTDGLPVNASSAEMVSRFCSWLSMEQLQQLIQCSGLPKEQTLENVDKKVDCQELASFGEERFYLPGREKLSAFFEHQVVDFFRHKEAYKRMGIHTLPAILLYGPPGSGKTFAVSKLAEFLRLPCFEANSETVASPYIHQTGKLISELFAKAIQAAPSILLIDEIEAYLGKREGASEHHIEEVDEFLRNIPMAIEKQVLIIGMTNHLDMIDPAVLRKGRFDQILEVEMPGKKEVRDALHHLLAKIPQSESLQMDVYAEKLTGHPLSDVAFLVREAARRTVRLGKEKIDDEVLSDVLQEICVKNEERNRRIIGF